MDLPLQNVLLFSSKLSIWFKPLWIVAVGAAVAIAALIGIYLLLQAVFPKIAAIARTTAKEAMAQPLCYVLLALGAFLLVLFPFVPYNTFGEDIKVVKDEGLTLIMVISIVLALLTASRSIAEEIEGRTALMVLSKPIGRASFILGKFLGILGPVALVFILLGALLLGSVSYKKVYDSRETGQPTPTREECQAEYVQILPGLALAFLEAVVLTAVSVAISTRLPMMPNLIICMSVYVLGHLVPMLVNSSAGQHAIVAFVGTILATILPVLDHFNIYAAIASGSHVPWSYVAWAGLYCVLYSSVAMLLALLAFETRDLA
jgi:ABC-type transport system involved in multi-copper enzyme maturation permease subunit